MIHCKNDALNAGGPYPKSCPQCRFGPCQKGVMRTLDSQYPENMYVAVNQPAEPRVENKYAVIYSDSIYHEGDERSRTNPGHGYPAWTETIEKIQTFKDEAALKEWILKNNTGYSRKTFTAIRYQELKVSTEVQVTLG